MVFGFSSQVESTGDDRRFEDRHDHTRDLGGRVTWRQLTSIIVEISMHSGVSSRTLEARKSNSCNDEKRILEWRQPSLLTTTVGLEWVR